MRACAPLVTPAGSLCALPTLHSPALAAVARCTQPPRLQRASYGRHLTPRSRAPRGSPGTQCLCSVPGGVVAVPAWRVRPALETDVEAIARVLAACSSSWGARHVAEELVRPIACVLVADTPDGDAAAADAVAGVAVAWRVAGDAHIMELAVRPTERRRGLGGALLAAACDAACSPGGACLLELRESNSGAAALYERHGFRRVGRRRGYYPDGEAAVLMTREPAG